MEHQPGGRVCQWQVLNLPCVWGCVRGTFQGTQIDARMAHKNDEKIIVHDKQRSEEAVRSLSDMRNRTRVHHEIHGCEKKKCDEKVEKLAAMCKNGHLSPF